jgi:hypothetical protein
MNTFILFVYGVFEDQEDIEYFCLEVIGQSEYFKSLKFVVEGNKNIIIVFDTDLDNAKLSEEIYNLCFTENIKYYFLLNRHSILSVNLPDPVNDFIFKSDTPENSMLKVEYKKKPQEMFDLDDVLDKLNQMGLEALTPEEKKFLDNFEN